ncbi:unnamed protein product, partial [Nesidiocoris tenuis]
RQRLADPCRAAIPNLDCPARHRPARVPAERRVSMAGDSALDRCSNGTVFPAL